MHHRIDQLGRAHPGAEAGRRHQVGRPGHVLHAARDDDVDVAGSDHLRRDRDCFQPRTAEHVDRGRGNLFRDSGRDRHLTGGILAQAGLQHATEDHLVNILARQPGPLERRPDGQRPSSVAGTSLNCPPKLPTGVRTALTITASSIRSSFDYVLKEGSDMAHMSIPPLTLRTAPVMNED